MSSHVLRMLESFEDASTLTLALSIGIVLITLGKTCKIFLMNNLKNFIISYSSYFLAVKKTPTFQEQCSFIGYIKLWKDQDILSGNNISIYTVNIAKM